MDNPVDNQILNRDGQVDMARVASRARKGTAGRSSTGPGVIALCCLTLNCILLLFGLLMIVDI